jgi:hypothetical protein
MYVPSLLGGGRKRRERDLVYFALFCATLIPRQPPILRIGNVDRRRYSASSVTATDSLRQAFVTVTWSCNMSSSFTPTPASIPPRNAGLMLRQPKGLPVYFQPLNPLQFILRAAEIYPDKLALVHPDVKYPVSYSFAVWYFLEAAFCVVYSCLSRCQRIQNLAYALIQAGIKPGDRVS